MFEFPRGWPKRIGLVVLSVLFVAIGVQHFTLAENFVAIMPDYLPWHLQLVWISGVFEILGGLGVLPVATRRWAGYGLLALLVAVFPANLNMVLHPDEWIAQGIPLWGLYLRLPFQLVFAAWIWWVTKPDPDPVTARPDSRPV